MNKFIKGIDKGEVKDKKTNPSEKYSSKSVRGKLSKAASKMMFQKSK